MQCIRSCLHFGLAALMLSFSSSLFLPNIFSSFLSTLHWLHPTHAFFLFFIHLISHLCFLIFFLRDPFDQTLTGVPPIPTLPRSILSSKTFQTPTLNIILAMPVCPRSVSCHPMGSMSFKALQAQPLPHCRSQERSLSRDAASLSSSTPRRRTTGTTQVRVHQNVAKCSENNICEQKTTLDYCLKYQLKYWYLLYKQVSS